MLKENTYKIITTQVSELIVYDFDEISAAYHIRYAA